MTDTFDYITRFVVIVFGYCCAVLAAGYFLAAVLYGQFDLNALLRHDVDGNAAFNPFVGNWGSEGFQAALHLGGFFFAGIAGAFSFFPALGMVIYSETKPVTSSLFYCVGGLLISLFAMISIGLFTWQMETIDSFSVMLYTTVACSGIVGGFVYWLIAGRKAGRFLARPAE